MHPTPFVSSRAKLVATDLSGIFYQQKLSTCDCTVRRTQSGAPTPSCWWRSKADVNTLEGVAGVRWICLSLLLHRYDWPNEIYGELSFSFSYITHTLAGAHNPLWNCPQTRSLGWMVARADVPDNRASLIPPPHLFLMLCSSLDIHKGVLWWQSTFHWQVVHEEKLFYWCVSVAKEIYL